MISKMLKKVNWIKTWYAMCFLALGIIDQRRGSASGEVQMAAANLTGVVMAGMIVPSLDKEKFKDKIYLYGAIVLGLIGIVVGIWGLQNWNYKGQWITGVLNVVIWGYLTIYIVREWKRLQLQEKIKQPFFVMTVVMFLLMLFSAHERNVSLWLIVVFGVFYLVGVQNRYRDAFFQGMLNGIILWFFVQQIIAFGFRPYDRIRYRGLYSGEMQNGLFYMIVYCAFMLKVISLWERKKSKALSYSCFLLSAGCISFAVYTGSRAPIMGAGIASIVIYVWYDIVYRRSFYRLIVHCMSFLLCVVITFPVVYGCIRYLPTILHHPIWFEGEYYENGSVRSFDPWDSKRYITFEKAVDESLGRILSAIGIDLKEWRKKSVSGILGIRTYAKEIGEPGDTPENPFTLPGVDLHSAMGARKVIYVYYWNHLNWRGHSGAEQGFFLTEESYMVHAHNMFLQIAYDYGILVGLLFIGVYFGKLFQTLRAGKDNMLEAMICVAFLLAILGFGFFEMVVVPGQITVVLTGIIFCMTGGKMAEVSGNNR
ncbi:MAG: hypothetical protein NC331_00590 [Lachnospiraceae bacterium]|nr:hypothetical protein [Lachnospiraceae bacterium]MCM1237865.1 hypothetical protein [Lachnospiraceae bacterium]